MITGRQIREARDLLGWTITALATRANLPRAHFVESRGRDEDGGITIAQARKVKRALEAAGVEFTNGDQPGVRLRAKG